jgi:hypothetical protein
MAVPAFARLARLSTLAACWVFALSLAAFALDIDTEEPGRWHFIPNWADMPIALAPLMVALVALIFAVVAAVRHEPEAYRLNTWLTSFIIVALYGLFLVLASRQSVI